MNYAVEMISGSMIRVPSYSAETSVYIFHGVKK
jgi:hypothetical protein